jgi:hypothetical protein
MMIRLAVTSAVMLWTSSMAFAASGTPEQQAACSPDVRRFCHTLKAQDSDDAYLQCLELHRDKLSRACSDMLKGYGK